MKMELVHFSTAASELLMALERNWDWSSVVYQGVEREKVTVWALMKMWCLGGLSETIN